MVGTHISQSMEISKNKKNQNTIELPCNPAIPLLGIHIQRNCNQYVEETSVGCLLQHHLAPFMIANKWKQSKCPSTDKWIKQCRAFNIIVISHKKNENTTFSATWMKLDIILSEISQA